MSSKRSLFKVKKYALAYFEKDDENNTQAEIDIIATCHICCMYPKVGNYEQMKFKQGLFRGKILALDDDALYLEKNSHKILLDSGVGLKKQISSEERNSPKSKKRKSTEETEQNATELSNEKDFKDDSVTESEKAKETEFVKIINDDSQANLPSTTNDVKVQLVSGISSVEELLKMQEQRRDRIAKLVYSKEENSKKNSDHKVTVKSISTQTNLIEHSDCMPEENAILTEIRKYIAQENNRTEEFMKKVWDKLDDLGHEIKVINFSLAELKKPSEKEDDIIDKVLAKPFSCSSSSLDMDIDFAENDFKKTSSDVKQWPKTPNILTPSSNANIANMTPSINKENIHPSNSFNISYAVTPQRNVPSTLFPPEVWPVIQKVSYECVTDVELVERLMLVLFTGNELQEGNIKGTHGKKKLNETLITWLKDFVFAHFPCQDQSKEWKRIVNVVTQKIKNKRRYFR